VTADPFAALGLPARPDLTDDDIRAAWRRIAAATHPDRADGGDPARFAAAAAAYTELRTRYGRGEAYADLAAGNRRPRPAPPGPVPRQETASHPGSAHPDTAPHPETAHRDTAHPDTAPDPETARPDSRPHPDTAHLQAAPDPDTAPRGTGPRRRSAARRGTAARLAARVRRGRPALLALRVAIAAAITAAAFAVVGAQPAAGGVAAGALTWLLLTARHDLAPPGT
jgi:hypothetical protein